MKLTCDDIYFHNTYFDMVAENPDKFDYSILFDVSFLSIVHRKKLLDFIFRKLIKVSYDDLILFKMQLKEYGMYEEYVQSIINGNDNFLKSCLIIYLEQDLKDKLFKSNKELLNTVVNSDEDEILKLSNVLNISQFVCDEDTFKLLKENFKTLLYKCNKNNDYEELNELLENYYTIMDNNQITLGNSKILKKE